MQARQAWLRTKQETARNQFLYNFPLTLMSHERKVRLTDTESAAIDCLIKTSQLNWIKRCCFLKLFLSPVSHLFEEPIWILKLHLKKVVAKFSSITKQFWDFIKKNNVICYLICLKYIISFKVNFHRKGGGWGMGLTEGKQRRNAYKVLIYLYEV